VQAAASVQEHEVRERSADVDADPEQLFSPPGVILPPVPQHSQGHAAGRTPGARVICYHRGSTQASTFGRADAAAT